MSLNGGSSPSTFAVPASGSDKRLVAKERKVNAEMAAALESGEAVIWPVHPYVLKRNTIYTHDLSTRPNITDLILSCSWDAKHHLHAWNATISLRKQGLKQLPVIPSLHICYFFARLFHLFCEPMVQNFPSPSAGYVLPLLACSAAISREGRTCQRASARSSGRRTVAKTGCRGQLEQGSERSLRGDCEEAGPSRHPGSDRGRALDQR